MLNRLQQTGNEKNETKIDFDGNPSVLQVKDELLNPYCYC